MPIEKFYSHSAEFAANARISGMDAYQRMFDEAKADPEAFWARIAGENIHWFRPWEKTLDSSEAPFYKWFVGGKTNMAYNCLDRHVENGRKDKPAILWEGEPGDQRTLTYEQLTSEVSRFANAITKLGY